MSLHCSSIISVSIISHGRNLGYPVRLLVACSHYSKNVNWTCITTCIRLSLRTCTRSLSCHKQARFISGNYKLSKYNGLPDCCKGSTWVCQRRICFKSTKLFVLVHIFLKVGNMLCKGKVTYLQTYFSDFPTSRQIEPNNRDRKSVV